MKTKAILLALTPVGILMLTAAAAPRPLLGQSPMTISGTYQDNSGPATFPSTNGWSTSSDYCHDKTTTPDTGNCNKDESGYIAYINPCSEMKVDGSNNGEGCSYATGGDAQFYSGWSSNFPEPGLTFTLGGTDDDGDAYNSTKYNIKWVLDINFKDRCQEPAKAPPNPCPTENGSYTGFTNKFHADSGADLLAGDQTYSVDWAGEEVGGEAKLVAYAYLNCEGQDDTAQPTAVATLVFKVLGANPDASSSRPNTNDDAVANALAAFYHYWYAAQIIEIESSGVGLAGRQFYTNGKPIWGDPDGIGLVQVDRVEQPAYFNGTDDPVSPQDPYWNYILNVEIGTKIMYGDESAAVTDWISQLNKMCRSVGGGGYNGNGTSLSCTGGHFMPFNKDNGLHLTCTRAALYGTYGLDAGHTGSMPIEFAFTQPSDTMSAIDANAIGFYNTGSAHFVQWVGTPVGHWAVAGTASPVYTYVFAVCNANPPTGN